MMKLEDLFDDKGLDGEDNSKAFARLPKVMKYFITTSQNSICNHVVRKVKEQYGQAGVNDLRKTSGFRSQATNYRNSGVADSLHLFGLACDFAKTGIFKDKFVEVSCPYECIDSGKCWHVAYKRK